MISSLKQELNDCYMYGEIITQQGFGPKTGISMKDMIRFDLLQYLAFLLDTKNGSMYSEISFIHEYLGEYFTLDRLIRFKDDRTRTPDYVRTVPRSITYFAEADLSGKSAYTTKGYSKSRNLYNLFVSMGQEFIVANGIETADEIDNLTMYTTMIENYLRSHKLYDSSPKAGSIKPSSSGSTPSKLSAADKKTTSKQAATSAALAAMRGELNKESIGEQEVTLDTLMNELNDLTGLEDVKKDIKSLVNLLKIKKLREERGMKQPSVSLHMVFSGNPGTGKTTVARLLAKIYGCLGVLETGQLVEVDRSGLVEGFVGQTATKTKEVVESALGGVLFIDEAYTLTANKDGKDFGQEAVDTLLKLMEDNRDNLIVIVAGYTQLMENFVNSNPGLKSRFNKYILFKDYTGDQLFDIFMSMCKKQDYEPNTPGKKYVKEYFTERVKSHDENFANAREVRNYLERAIARQASRIVTIDNITDKQIRTLTKADLEESIEPSAQS
ncbi:MAG: AAA family ATPase [Lachnospiraceae bacterium]|nr:AAA family ATPase [Lachnospiraceae bacterium]